jgi:ABC-type Na+ efflux pump permease subunit
MKEQESSLIGIGKPSITLLIFSIIHFGVTLLIFIGKNSGGTGNIEDSYTVAVLYLILFSALSLCIGLIFIIIGFRKKKNITKLISLILLCVALITIILLFYIKSKFNVFVDLPIGASFNEEILNLVSIFMLVETIVLLSLGISIGFLRTYKKPV